MQISKASRQVQFKVYLFNSLAIEQADKNKNISHLEYNVEQSYGILGVFLHPCAELFGPINDPTDKNPMG